MYALTEQVRAIMEIYIFATMDSFKEDWTTTGCNSQPYENHLTAIFNHGRS
jgi:hypothetical protein